jgi:16S rRNA (uracil1498-N3)-methyltransferase
VQRVVPVEAVRSERGLFDGSRSRVERWRRIAREASEQSRRLRPPEIAQAVKMAEALRDDSSHRLWLDEKPGAPPLLRAFVAAPGDSAAVLIGPEGGWTDGEREAAVAAGWMPASLGNLVLRAETAVCASLALVSQMLSAVSPAPEQ